MACTCPSGDPEKDSECIIICYMQFLHFSSTLVAPEVCCVEGCAVRSEQAHLNIICTHMELAGQHDGLRIQFAVLAFHIIIIT